MPGPRFFFYGTLCDAAVRARVLGAAENAISVRPATAPGWCAVYARGHDFPVLVPRRGDSAPGLVVNGLVRDAVQHLIAYEDSGYRIGAVVVVTEAGDHVRASAFLPRRHLRPGANRFDLARWQELRRRGYLRRLA